MVLEAMSLQRLRTGCGGGTVLCEVFPGALVDLCVLTNQGPRCDKEPPKFYFLLRYPGCVGMIETVCWV